MQLRNVVVVGWSLAVGLECLGGCGPAQEQEAHAEASPPTWEEFLGSAHTLPSGVLVADGDEGFQDVAALRRYYDARSAGGEYGTARGELIVSLKEDGARDIWGPFEKRDIWYCVDRASLGSRYDQVVADLAAAARDWGYAADVRFRHAAAYDSDCHENQGNVKFDVRAYPLDANMVAWAGLPSMPRHQRSFLINPTFLDNQYGKVQAYLRHELGHMLGFRHEHLRNTTKWECKEIGGPAYEAVTASDNSSVMHYLDNSCVFTFQIRLGRLSEKDRQGATAVYGPPPFQPL